MRYLKLLLVFALFAIAVSAPRPVKAQCAVCTVNVETNAKNGGTQANGLNKGIMYLLAAPYLAVAAIGFLWYKKYKRKDVKLKIHSEKLNLN